MHNHLSNYSRLHPPKFFRPYYSIFEKNKNYLPIAYKKNCDGVNAPLKKNLFLAQIEPIMYNDFVVIGPNNDPLINIIM